MSRLLAALICAGLSLAQQASIETAWDLLAKGNRKQAIALLREIIRASPRNADAHLLLGSVLMEEGNRTESIAQLNEAVRLNPKSAEALNALGEADPKVARPSFEKAIALDPALAQARVNLGLVLVQSNEMAAAAKQLDRAIALLGHKPDAAFPHYLRAKVYTEKNETQNAASELNEAVSLRPDFAEAWSDLGQARKNLLDDDGALKAFERAVAADPNDAVAQYRLGAEYLVTGKPHEAVGHLQNALAINPEDQSTLNSLQLALRQDGQQEEAAKVRRRLAELLRKRDTASQRALDAIQLNNEGASLEKAGNLPDALKKYRAALDLYPEHIGIRVNVAAALLHLGQRTQGLAELREAARRDPENTTVKAALADALAHAPPEP
jgi:protein O-GlcNAc transferase